MADRFCFLEDFCGEKLDNLETRRYVMSKKDHEEGYFLKDRKKPQRTPQEISQPFSIDIEHIEQILDEWDSNNENSEYVSEAYIQKKNRRSSQPEKISH